MKLKKKMIKQGITICRIQRTSPAKAAGMQKNDVIIAVNGEPIEDELDFSFYTARETFEIQTRRKSKINRHVIHRLPGEFLGFEFLPVPMQRCKNKCVFCFIDQLPSGMRKSLYIKDEDYRHSFLDGNYVTLSSLTKGGLEKIVRLGLSPLYISVHATEPEIRTKMLNNPFAGRIMEQLKTLQERSIAFHTQIVVCPEYNDGPVLEKTIRDLLLFHESLLSIAVVPVGVTKHRKKFIKPVSRRGAQRICNTVMALSELDKRHAGLRRLFIADEMLLKAGITIPPNTYYENYPQVANGVGLVRLMLEEWKMIKKGLRSEIQKNISPGDTRPGRKKKRFILLTSVSALQFLELVCRELEELIGFVTISVKPVENRFFGESVTVAGLITAKDVIYTAKKLIGRNSTVIVPQVIFNHNNYTLDGYSIDRISKNAKAKVVAVENLTHLVRYITKGRYGKKK